jgi:tetratricopeptide (TPR) repeat protein
MNKKISKNKIYILFTIFTLAGCAYYNTLFNAKKSYDQGIDAIRKSSDPTKTPTNAKRYFETTIDKCWKLIEIYGDNSKYADDALLYIGKSEFYVEKYTQSKLHLQQLLDKYPKSNLKYETQLWLGKSLIRLNDFEMASEQLNSVITNSKRAEIRAEAYFELGFYEFENENYEKAQEYFEKALSEKPSAQYKASLQFYLGETYFNQKDYKNAIRQYEKVEKFSPTIDIEYRTQFHLARSYIESKKYQDGYRILTRMLTAPRFQEFVPSIKTAMGEGFEKEGRVQYAMDIYTEVLAENKPSPGTAQASLNLARLYERQFKNLDSAIVYYGLVKAIYNKYDSVDVATAKQLFLTELKVIRDAIKRDERLAYRLENDDYFRDSLYQAQLYDSLKQLAGNPEADSLLNEFTSDTVFFRTDSFYVDIWGDTVWTKEQNEEEGQTNEQQTSENEEGEPLLNEQSNLLEQEQQALNQPPQPQIQKPTLKPEKNEVEHRKLPEIKEDLMNNRYHIGEYYLLKVENYDSAAHYYHKFLSIYEDSILSPKAFYSLRFIYSKAGYENPAKADSLEQLIINRYPESIFAKDILSQKGLLEKEEEQDILERQMRSLYLQAEDLYFSNRYREAIQAYERVIEVDTTSRWGAKAMLAQAWIYERNLNEKDSALAAYEKIKTTYPQAKDIVSYATLKTAAVGTNITSESVAVSDSAEVGGESMDSLGVAGKVVEKTQVNGEIEKEHTSSNIIEREKIMWRRARDKR